VGAFSLNHSLPRPAQRRTALALAIGGLLLAGCSGRPGAVEVVAVDAAAIGKQLVADHDEDGDGLLAAAELERLGAIHDRLDKYDADGDGKLSPQELEDNVTRVFDGQTGLLSASCRVTRNGQPLRGAYVYFVPIDALHGKLPVASGVTENGGVATLSIQKDDLPVNAPPVSGLIRPGLYAVEVTHPTVKIPEIYNAHTTLGHEVTQETCSGGPLQVALKF
jgi:hypothetical protein